MQVLYPWNKGGVLAKDECSSTFQYTINRNCSASILLHPRLDRGLLISGPGTGFSPFPITSFVPFQILRRATSLASSGLVYQTQATAIISLQLTDNKDYRIRCASLAGVKFHR